jgi:hypothetical protein
VVDSFGGDLCDDEVEEPLGRSWGFVRSF